MRPDSGHFGDKIPHFEQEDLIRYTPNFLGRDPLFWIDGSLDRQRPTFENLQAELPAPPVPIKNVKYRLLNNHSSIWICMKLLV